LLGAQQSRWFIRDASVKTAWPRLAAEFIIIVAGVLVALSVDSLVSWTHDRELEAEYLERLLQDVDYDLAELDFVEMVAEAAEAYADSLLMPGVPGEWGESHLVAAVALASNSRQADLSRSTFQELVTSGRIGLIRSPELRAQLADYDRQFLELVGFWDRATPDFQIWVRSRVPNRVIRDFGDACGRPDAPSISDPTVVCPFEIRGWSAADLRSELGSDEARLLLNLQSWRIDGTLGIARVFRASAQRLRTTIVADLEHAMGAR